MMAHVPALKRMNALGYLTVESQAGRHHNNNEQSERAYVEGFMLQQTAERFIERMGTKTDKNAVYVPACGEDVHLPASLDVPLTTANQRVVTHTSVALPSRIEKMYRRELRLGASEQVVLVLCWDPKWNRAASGKRGLFTEVLACLEDLSR